MYDADSGATRFRTSIPIRPARVSLSIPQAMVSGVTIMTCRNALRECRSRCYTSPWIGLASASMGMGRPLGS